MLSFQGREDIAGKVKGKTCAILVKYIIIYTSLGAHLQESTEA